MPVWTGRLLSLLVLGLAMAPMQVQASEDVFEARTGAAEIPSVPATPAPPQTVAPIAITTPVIPSFPGESITLQRPQNLLQPIPPTNPFR